MAKPRVRIDWPSGVSFAADVTSNIIGEIECWRGRSYSNPTYRQQGVGVAGHCTFVLRNDNGRYAITDDDNVPTGARVRVDLQVGASDWRTMWTGYIDTYDYQYRRQGYDRIAVRALGRMAQLETATWSINGADPDPRAYDVINSIVQGVTGEGVESGYNETSNRNLEPPGGDDDEGSRDWSVRLENFRLDEAPALQAIRDAATISFAHVYETAAGTLRIQGLPARQTKIDGSAEMTFRDTNGTGVRVHDYEIGLKNERIANAAARSITERFGEVDTTVRYFAQGDGTKTLSRGGTGNVNDRLETTEIRFYRNGSTIPTNHVFPGVGPISPTTIVGVHYPGPRDQIYYERGAPGSSLIRPLRAPYPAGITLYVHFQPQAYLFEDPDGVLDPVLTTPSPYTETLSFANDYSTTTRITTDRRDSNGNVTGRPQETISDTTRIIINRTRGTQGQPTSGRTRVTIDYMALPFTVSQGAGALSDATWRWELEYRPFAQTASGSIIASNSDSITKFGRRGYAIPGIYWGPDVNTEGDDYLDIRSFVGYIVRDEFLGEPGYYGTIVVDLTRQYYPTDGATNPELDVGDKITLLQGTTSRDFLVSAIRYRFRQGEQLRAQIECAPARVM